MVKKRFVLIWLLFLTLTMMAQKQCPGITVIGRGYDVFGEYANNKSVKTKLFDLGASNVEAMDDGEEYSIPKLVELKYINEKNYYVTEGRSLRKYAQSMSASVGLSYNGLLFKASIQSRFGKDKSSESSNYFKTITDYSRIWEVSLNALKEKKLREYLLPEVKAAIDTLDPSEVFKLLGTHFIKSGFLGGSMEFSLSESFDSQEEASSVDIAISAKYGKFSGNSDFNQNDEEVNKKYLKNVTIYARGGDAQAVNESTASDNSQYNKWVNSIPSKSVLVDFRNGSLAGIWELAETRSRRNELEAAFKKLLTIYPLPDEIANKLMRDELYYIQPEVDRSLSWDLTGYHFDAVASGSSITLAKNGNGADRFYKIGLIEDDPAYVYLQPQNAYSVITSTGVNIITKNKPNSDSQNNDSQRYKMIELGKNLYLLQNKASGMYLTKQGNSIVHQAKNGSPEQQWFFKEVSENEMAPPPLDQLMKIKNLAAGKYIDISGYPGDQTIKGSMLLLNDYDSHIDRLYRIEKVNDNRYLIRCNNENNVFEVTNQESHEGNSINLWTQHGHDSQLFTFEYAGKPRTYYIKNVLSERYLVAEANSTNAVDNKIVLGGKDKSLDKRMQWEMTPMQWDKQILSNKTYHIRAAYSDYVMDVCDAKDVNGTNVVIYDNYHAAHQKFKFRPSSISNGIYYIEAQNGGKVFDIRNGTANNDEDLTIYEKHYGENQRFKVVPTSEYTFAIITLTGKNDTKALTVYGGNPWNKGNKIVQYTQDYQYSQHWVLLKEGTNTPVEFATEQNGLNISLPAVNDVDITVDASEIDTNDGSLTLPVDVIPGNASNTSITWGIPASDTANASIDVVTGEITAKRNGSITVYAKSKENGDIIDSAVVTIKNQIVEPTSIEIFSEGDATRIDDSEGTLQLSATIAPLDVTNPSVEWSVNKPSIASVSANGLVTAIGNGQVKVTAIAKEGNAEASIELTISNQIASVANISVQELKVYPNPVSTLLYLDNVIKCSKIEIISVSGQVLDATENYSSNKALDVSKLSNGLYILKAVTDKGIYKTVFIKL